jgi:threonine synthase
LGAIANKRLEELSERGLVIVATSGDTGSAAIQAVKDSENIDIVVLHPKDKISEYQRKQMTTVIQPNVLNIAVEGTYDDCQRIAKELLSTNPFARRIISLNSINWLRVMGQLSYYVWLTKQFTSPINVAIPSGNFGNAYSAWYGRKHGLPINEILCTTNVNDVLRRFIESGVLQPQKTQASLSPSMDIQIPSSLERLIFDLLGDTTNFYKDLYDSDSSALSDAAVGRLQSIFSSTTYLDSDIQDSIKHTYDTYGVIVDPHSITAVTMALHHKSSIPTVAVATASPEKFSSVVAPLVKEFEVISIEGDEVSTECSSEITNVVEAISAYFS